MAVPVHTGQNIGIEEDQNLSSGTLPYLELLDRTAVIDWLS